MPIYEYRCEDCGQIREILVLSNEDVPIRCPNCGSTAIERIMSAASYVDASSFRASGTTCCGREERCAEPPCSSGGGCRRDF